MKILNHKIHGILDYVTVIGFAVAPTIFGLSGLPATISYALAVIHLLLTLITAFVGIAAIVPLAVHGVIELIVSICLIALPFVLGFEGAARNFYLGAGVIIFLVWLLTNYRAAETA